MAETYCGKTCAECAEKLASRCPGCRMGPGREFGGTCKLAFCVREKGHETCDTCGYRFSCGMRMGRDRMAEQRARELAVQDARWQAVAQIAPTLAKWLFVMFWLFVPSSIASILTNEQVVQLAPVLWIPGMILNMLCSVIYCVALLKLSAFEDHYRTAGWCRLASFCVVTLVSVITGTAEAPAWTLLITLPAAVVSLVGQYHAYMAHSAVLNGVENTLSENWAKLWKWQIGLYAALFGCILILMIIPLLGLLVLIGSGIGLILVGIMELVFLYRSAAFFRNFPDSVVKYDENHR